MRKITAEMASAFLNDKPYILGNTAVEITPEATIFRLHGNAIAYLKKDPNRTLEITTAGWFSNTTKERLNGLPGVSISQKKGVWYLNGKVWDGKLIAIK